MKASGTNMKISLIHPSRGRPQKALETYNQWLSMSKESVEHILSLDNDDPTLGEYQDKFSHSIVIVNPNTSVVEATNVAATIATGDILIYLSDDFKCFHFWDEALRQEFMKYTGPTLIKVDDCLQQFHVRVLTIPMMNKELYQKLGYFWHPEYKSMWVDCDLYETVRRMGALYFARHLKFEHHHPSNGKAQSDETYRRSEANWNQGKELFIRRRLKGFA